MFPKLLKLLFHKDTAGEVLSLKRYRQERAEAERLLANEQLEAKSELEIATAIPRAIYQKRVTQARADFYRVEQEVWQAHLRRIEGD